MANENKKDLKKWLILILVAIIGFWAINNFNTVGIVFGRFFNIVFPFVLGACLAFIFNIPMTFFEKKLLKNKKIKNKKLIRILSIIFAAVVILLVFILIIGLIVPELVNIVNLLIDNIPYYIEEITNLIENNADKFPDLNNVIQNINIDIESIRNEIIDQIPTILTSSISLISSIINGITTFFIAIVFAVYILIDKEKLAKQAKKIIYAYLSKEKNDKIINIGNTVNITFKRFFTVQCLEATILGTLCCIGMLILRIPYALQIGILVGVTALIPIVGAFIGTIIGAVLILSIEPIKVVAFVIFVLILQQIEGNFIYPKVVGKSIGLPGMWVLVAVTVGGAIGGILGMLLGVPIATIIYTLLKTDVNKKLKQKKAIITD